MQTLLLLSDDDSLWPRAHKNMILIKRRGKRLTQNSLTCDFESHLSVDL